jgi:23S rRNA G2069 N7-methylase RlmK/C1962 C5-methylase RlmI
VAAAAGGARSTTNVDNKQTHLNTAVRNYELNSLPCDSRTTCCEDAVRFVKVAKEQPWKRYDLLLLDPPPHFGRRRGQSDWEFDASEDFGQLLGLCLQVVSGPGAIVLAGFPHARALGDEEDHFRKMIAEAEAMAGVRLCPMQLPPGVEDQGQGYAVAGVGRINPGCDFPHCPHRPSARFLLAEVMAAPAAASPAALHAV